jgi:hypothetical protein
MQASDDWLCLSMLPLFLPALRRAVRGSIRCGCAEFSKILSMLDFSPSLSILDGDPRSPRSKIQEWIQDPTAIQDPRLHVACASLSMQRIPQTIAHYSACQPFSAGLQRLSRFGKSSHTCVVECVQCYVVAVLAVVCSP